MTALLSPPPASSGAARRPAAGAPSERSTDDVAPAATARVEPAPRSVESAAPIRVVFAGGGTGGHLYPALAAARALEALAPGSRAWFLGSDRPLERQILAPTGYAHVALPTAPWRGLRDPRGAARFACSQLQGVLRARTLLRELGPQVVVGLGGFPSVGPVVAARLLGIPVALFEPNAVPGRANALLARVAHESWVHWERTPLAGRRVNTGTPVDARALPAASLSAADARRRLGLPAERPTVLVMGGSQGARALNRWIEEHLVAAIGADRRPIGEALSFVHLAGSETAAASLRAVYERAGCPAAVCAFLPEIGLAYRAADLALVRGGGATLAELAAEGLPAVVVPLPSAAGDHQRHNARAFVAEGGGTWIEERDLDAGALRRVVALAGDPSALAAAHGRTIGRQAIGRQASGAGRITQRRDAANQIARRLLALAQARG